MVTTRQRFLDGAERQELAEAVRRPANADLPAPCSACTVRQLTICGGLTAGEMQELATIISNVELYPGQALFQEGDTATNAYSVTAGTVKIYKLLPDGRCQVTGFLFPGDFLGLANNESYAYSAEAVSHAVLCTYPRRRLERLLERFPDMERRLLGMANHELAVAQEQMLLLGRKTAKERLASFLLTLSRNAARRGQSGDPVLVPMSRSDIGDYLGLTTETVSRTFTQLRKSGLIRIESGGRVALADKIGLENLAEGC